MNFFELYDLDISPKVDHTFVAKKYVELQRKFHPDFFTNAHESDKEETLQQSANVNDAYRIFKNQQQTIAYYLKEKGLITDDEKYQLPNAFLMDMMEINEGILEEGNEATANNIATIEHELEGDVEGILNKIPAELSATDHEILKAYYYKKKYLQRILDRIDD